MIEGLVASCLILAAIPFCLTVLNLCFYRPLGRMSGPAGPVSVLIPARNEQDRLPPVLEALARNSGDDVEIIVGDDASSDATAPIVREFCNRDRRIRMISIAPALEGWAGKNNACQQLAEAARHNLLVFLDADVVVTDDCLARVTGHMAAKPDIALLSGFPRQITGSFWEHLLIPLIHFLLLGYLPFVGVKYSRHPMFGTACGQLVAVRKATYMDVDGHASFKSLLHDGLHLPRRLRKAGHCTDLADFTDLARTRMYDNAEDLRAGLMKNAHEAMATPVALPIWTVVLILGHILPVIIVLVSVFMNARDGIIFYAAVATALGFAIRGILALRFRQSFWGVVLHPLAVAALLRLQWRALLNRKRGGKVSWKGRQY